MKNVWAVTRRSCCRGGDEAERDRHRRHRAQLVSKCFVHARLVLSTRAHVRAHVRAEAAVADARHFYWRKARLYIRPPGWNGLCM